MISFTCWNMERPVQSKSDFDNEIYVVNWSICWFARQMAKRFNEVAKNIAKRKTSEKSRMTHLACAKVEKQNQKQQKKRPKATYSQLTKCKLSIDNLFFVLNNLTTIRFSSSLWVFLKRFLKILENTYKKMWNIHRERNSRKAFWKAKKRKWK